MMIFDLYNDSPWPDRPAVFTDWVPSDDAICPVCGGENGDLWEHAMDDEDEYEVICDHCDADIVLQCSYTIHYRMGFRSAFPCLVLEPPFTVMS